MITATQNLENDHVQILRLIEVMQQLTLSTDPDIEHLELIVKVIREFADGLHHAKEEQLLFPLMVQKGFSNESGPVAVMLHDHADGRNFVKGLAESISQYKLGDTAALKAICTNIQGYVDLLTNHIAKENNVLFRMADNAISADEQEALLHEFTRLELESEDHPGKAGYIIMIDKLYSLYVK